MCILARQISLYSHISKSVLDNWFWKIKLKKSFWQSISGVFSRYGQKIGSIFSDLFTLGFVALLVYVVYKTCVAAQTGYATNDEYRPTGSGYQPPPPGFRDEYTQRGMNWNFLQLWWEIKHIQDFDNIWLMHFYIYGMRWFSPFPFKTLRFFFPFLVGCGPTPTYSTGTGAGTGGGFWSGAFTGGILGYMLGNNRNNYYAPGYTTPYSTGWGYNTPRASRGWFSSGSGLGSGFGGGSTSTGTRTASGFGGTKRRWIYLVWIDTAR